MMYQKEYDHMKNWVEKHLAQSIFAQKQKKTISKCILDLKLLARKAQTQPIYKCIYLIWGSYKQLIYKMETSPCDKIILSIIIDWSYILPFQKKKRFGLDTVREIEQPIS